MDSATEYKNDVVDEVRNKNEELWSRCANCWQCFSDRLNRVYFIDFSVTSSANNEEGNEHRNVNTEVVNEDKNEVSILEALSFVYGFPLQDMESPQEAPEGVGTVWQKDDECVLCEKCAISLTAFYHAYQELRMLAHETSYISKGLEQLHDCIHTRYYIERDDKIQEKEVTRDQKSSSCARGAMKKKVLPMSNAKKSKQPIRLSNSDRKGEESKPIAEEGNSSPTTETSRLCDADEIPCDLEIVKVETLLHQAQSEPEENFQRVQNAECASPQEMSTEQEPNKTEFPNQSGEQQIERGTMEIILADGRVIRTSTRTKQGKQTANVGVIKQPLTSPSKLEAQIGKKAKKRKGPSLAQTTAKIETEIESILQEICNEIYYTEENLKTLKDGKFLCPEVNCSKAFKGLKTLNKHALSHKELKRSYHCIKCDTEFSDRQQMKFHVQQFHLSTVTTCKMKTGKMSVTNSSKSVSATSIYQNSLIRSPIKKSTAELNKSDSSKTPEKNYKCEHCDKMFIEKSVYEKHLASHDVQAEQCQCRCTLCIQLFPTVLSLTRHIELHHSSDNSCRLELNYTCSKCSLPTSFLNYGELKSHFEEHHKEDRLNFCTKCGNTFSTLYHLRRHYRNVHQIEPTMVEESNDATACVSQKEEITTDKKDNKDSTTPEHENFFRELIDMKPTEENQENKKEADAHDGKASRSLFKCTKCNKEFKRKHQLNTHTLFHNETDPHFGCSQCPKKFFQPNALRTHMLLHTKTNPLLCKQCDKVFERRDHFKRHMDVVHAKNRERKNRQQNLKKEGKGKHQGLTCSECHKTFSRKEYLRLHMRIHTGEKPHTCDTCGKEFRDPRNLVQHLVTHKTDRPFCCSVCGLTFKRAHHLHDHEGTHRQNIARPFVCAIPYCGKAFKLRKHLVSHELVHSGSKDHACHVCGRSFSRKDNLRQHINKIHGKEQAEDLLVVVEEQRDRLRRKQAETQESNLSITDNLTSENSETYESATAPVLSTSVASKTLSHLDTDRGVASLGDIQTLPVFQGTPEQEPTGLDFASTSYTW